MKDNRTKYEILVQDRTKLRYLFGLFLRWFNNLQYEHRRRIARNHGAQIGEGVILTKDGERLLNHNFIIGNHSSLHNVKFSSNLHKVRIGDNVIIGDGVRIIRGSHNIDSPEFENIEKNEELVIEDYVWLCPNCVIAPSVKKIGYGAVVSTNSVVVKDVEPMSVVGGNPAKEIKKRMVVHKNLVVESLLGGDYYIYIDTWKRKNDIK